MSEFNSTLAAIVTERQPFTADRGEILTGTAAGTFIRAELEEISDVELNAELGRDPREAYTLHLVTRAEANKLAANDRVRFIIRGVPLTLMILPGRRQDSIYSPVIKFGCMKITDKDT